MIKSDELSREEHVLGSSELPREERALRPKESPGGKLAQTRRLDLALLAAWPVFALVGLLLYGSLVWKGVLPDRRSPELSYWIFLSAVVCSVLLIERARRRSGTLFGLGILLLLAWSLEGYLAAMTAGWP